MRPHADQITFAHENRELPPVQYPAVVGILDQWVRAIYDLGVGAVPRVRGLPYNQSSTSNTELIAEKLRKDIRARRIFV